MTRLSPQLRKPFICLLLALVTFATFWPVINNGFIEYDDDEYIFENPEVKAGWTAHGFAWAFMGFHSVNYHPLTWLSHMTDCQFFGVNAGAHHLVSVALHAANAVLLLLLLNRLTGKFWRSAFVAAVFALHPLRVESVAWAAERKDVLCAFFFLLSLLAYVKCVTRDASPAKPAGGAGEHPCITDHGSRPRLALFFYVCALLSKQMAVTLPVILLLLDFWPLRRVSNFKSQARSLLLEKWPFFLLSAIFSAVVVWAQHGTLSKEPVTLIQRVSFVIADYFAYVEKILWPQNLSFLYERHGAIPLNHLLLALVVLLAISALALFYWRSRSWLLTGWLWFLVMLAPVTLVALNKLSIADRYTYLPSIGLSIMLVWSVAETGNKFFANRFGKIFGSLGAAIILLLCACQTQKQIGYWKNSQTLTEHALELDPDNDVAAQILRIYRFEQEHPGVREKNSHVNPVAPTPR